MKIDQCIALQGRLLACRPSASRAIGALLLSSLVLAACSSAEAPVTGEGTANSATAVMELGMDPRFDLSHEGDAYAVRTRDLVQRVAARLA